MGFEISFTPSGSTVEPTLIEAITTVGITAGLQTALDAGDSNSYSGTGQSWLDTSGNGQDFFRGSTGSASSDDPTFNGSAGGKSSSEFWSFDGGDHFKYDSANESWMNGLHLANTTFTMVAVTFGIAEGRYFGTRFSDPGVFMLANATRNPRFLARRSGGTALDVTADTALTNASFNFHTLTIDEAGGNVSFFTLNGAFNQVSSSDTFNAAYSSPGGTADPFFLSAIDGGGGGNNTASGDQHAMYAFWDIAISKANLDALFAEVQNRFGL